MWSSVDRFLTQGIQFVFSILIARLLLPSDYGVVAMLSIFLAISQTFVDSGFSTALVRKLDRTDADFSTVFLFQYRRRSFLLSRAVAGLSLYCGFLRHAPVGGRHESGRADTCVLFLFGSPECQTLHSYQFQDRSESFCDGGLCCREPWACGWRIAVMACGLWWRSLCPRLCCAPFSCGFSSVGCRSSCSSWRSFREMFSFGSKLLASRLLDTVYNNVYTLVIGRCFSSSTLGVYSPCRRTGAIPVFKHNERVAKCHVPYSLLHPERTRATGGHLQALPALVGFRRFPPVDGGACGGGRPADPPSADRQMGGRYLPFADCMFLNDVVSHPRHQSQPVAGERAALTFS